MYPKRDQLDDAVYNILKSNKKMHVRQMYAYIKNEFKMTDSELARKDSDNKSLIEHEIRWSLQSLKT